MMEDLLIKDLLKRKGKTLTQLAKTTNIPYRTLQYKIKNGNWNKEEMNKIAVFFEMRLDEIQEFITHEYQMRVINKKYLQDLNKKD